MNAESPAAGQLQGSKNANAAWPARVGILEPEPPENQGAIAPDPLVVPKQAAAIVGLSVETIRAGCRDGRWGYRVGGRLRVDMVRLRAARAEIIAMRRETNVWIEFARAGRREWRNELRRRRRTAAHYGADSEVYRAMIEE